MTSATAANRNYLNLKERVCQRSKPGTGVLIQQAMIQLLLATTSVLLLLAAWGATPLSVLLALSMAALCAVRLTN
jgi:hypothetical protein